MLQVHGVDADGNVVFCRQLKRRYVLALFEKLPPCLVGIEACAPSHYWSRELHALGHTRTPDAAAYVISRTSNDARTMADAEAICEAVINQDPIRGGIMASDHVNRINRLNTWPLRPLRHA